MSTEWLKVEKATPRKPEVLRIASILGIHPDHAFGLCFRFWAWCDEQLTEANARGVSVSLVDALVDRSGFAAAMVAVGWIREVDGSFEVVNFDRHLSQSAKIRGQTAKRVSKHAKTAKQKTNAPSVSKALANALAEEEQEKEKRECDKSHSLAASPRVKFQPPELEEVAEFCRNRNNGIDAEAFVAFYASKGWVVGKQPMKDWRAAVITWEKSRKERGERGERPLTSEELYGSHAPRRRPANETVA